MAEKGQPKVSPREQNSEQYVWGYKGKTGPAAWSSLHPDYATCAIGTQQSPIDITASTASKCPPLVTAYFSADTQVLNNGYTIRVSAPTMGTLWIGDTQWQLQQFHFHSPSEHRVKGRKYPLEAHLVHKNSEGALAVVSILFEEGASNPVLTATLDVAPERAGVAHSLAMVDATGLLPAELSYFRYQGSLTTPPCTEQVTWHVLQARAELSSLQLAQFQKLYSGNTRPLMPLHNRIVERSK